MSKKNIQIAIDGYAGCGKSTFARNIASTLGFIYIPSGILYRLVTQRMIDASISPSDVNEENLKFLENLVFTNDSKIIDSVGETDINSLNTKEIRQNVALYAQNPLIREKINAFIRASKKDYSSVVEGRDIGSVVLPNADLKYFLYGSIDYRIKCWENGQVEKYGSFDQNERDSLYQDTIVRDKLDETRELDPLVCTSDAIKIDVEQLHGQKLLEKALDDISKILNE